MKRVFLIFAIITALFTITNIYASSYINSPMTINLYNEPVDNVQDVTDTTYDGVSIGIIIASIVVLGCVFFLYLMPNTRY